MAEFIIRDATVQDCPLILSFIKGIAEYEKLSHQVECTEESLRHSMFELNAAKAILAYEDQKPVGFALYFYNFSTFTGVRGLYLEDLFLLPEERSKGYGKALLLHLAHKARAEGCKRMEWTCLDWNKPSIDFYLSLGAVPMSEWTIYRLGEDALAKL